MISEANKWIGYLEHLSNDDLGCYCTNVGKGGCTIFSLIICRHYPKLNFMCMPWCVVFVFAISILAYGKDKAYEVLGEPCAGSRLLTRRIKRRRLLEPPTYTPSMNDLVFFYDKNKRICHCGIVEALCGDSLISIEGNTIDPSGYFDKNQGGAVARRVRSINDESIACYARLSEILQ